MAGAGGHISHPYELSWIKNGNELLNLFERIKNSVKHNNSASLKIDGVNLSFRVIKEDGKYEFAIDRGTTKEQDVRGVSLSRINERFPPQHGMIGYSTETLTMLNEALPNILGELKLLGMLDDPSRFFNTEYVSNKTNIIEHKQKFLAIHGINQFYSRGNRKGPIRPDNITDIAKEVRHDTRVFERLIKKLTPFAEKHGFSIHNQILAESTREIDFSSPLETLCEVQISSTTKVSRTLREWLKTAHNTHNERVRIYNESPAYATSRRIYNSIKEGTPITDFIYEEDAKKAINGFIMVEATRLLGQSVINSMTSSFGEVKEHEGIVVRDRQINPHGPIKITGNFIIEGQASPFNKKITEDQVIGSESTLAIVPGAFKPPHRGHLAVVEHLSKTADKVIVLISAPLKDTRTINGIQEITAEHSKKIWETIGSGFDNVEYVISPKASPINAAYDFIEANKNNYSSFMLGISNKGKDFHKFSQAFKNVSDVNFLPLSESMIEAVQHSEEYKRLFEKCQFKNEFPSVKGNYDPFALHSSDMRFLMSKKDDPIAVSMMSDFISEQHTDKVLSIVEMSGAGGAGAFGYSGGIKKNFYKKHIPRKLRKEHFLSSSLKESIINDVYELITNKGMV